MYVQEGMGCDGLLREERGRTGQIRDLIYQTDNGAKMTKQLEAFAGVLRERKSILNFKQSPPQGSLQPPSPNPRLSFPTHESSGS